MNEKDVVQYAIERGILDLDKLYTAVDEMNRTEYLEKHPYEIWQNKDGLWMTHILDENGKRLLRKRKTKKEILDMLVSHYKSLDEAIYIEDVFTEWIDGRLRYGEIKKQSYDRYKTDYGRFFKKSDKICQKKFRNISESDLEDYIKRTIHDLGLTQKSYSGLVTLLGGIFRFGKKSGYTDISITSFLGDLVIPKTMFTKNYKEKESEVFMEDEIPVITQFLRQNPDIWNLGLLLQFQTGARIGEISSLKPSDIGENRILIRRTEIKYKDDDGHWMVKVEDVPKTDAGYREIIIPTTAQWTIEKILELNPDGEYLFMNKGKRIRENTFNKRLSTVCEKLGLRHRSSHKIRKTYGTTLLDNNVMDSFVAEQMGHTDVSTTRKLYYYSNKKRETKLEQIQNAVSF